MIRVKGYGSFLEKMNPVHEMWDYLKTQCMRRGIDYDHYQELCQRGKKDLLNFGVEKFTSRKQIEQYADYLLGDFDRLGFACDDWLYENNRPHDYSESI